MAPVQPAHRTSLPAKSILKSSSSSTPAASSTTKASSKIPPTSLFPANKSDKRRIKHSALLSKITKSNPSSSQKPKRRRPNKKLVTTLSSLADALPTADSPTATADASTSPVDGSASKEAAGYTPQAQVNVIRRRSVKSKPGALKRKQKMDNEERRRWGKNVAQLSGAGNVGGSGVGEGGAEAVVGMGNGGDGVRERWAALRGFIGQTLERRTDVKVSGGA